MEAVTETGGTGSNEKRGELEGVMSGSENRFSIYKGFKSVSKVSQKSQQSVKYNLPAPSALPSFGAQHLEHNVEQKERQRM